MKRILVGLFFIISLKSFAQKPEVIGIVRDAISRETIPGATVIISGTTIGTSTDSMGRYAIQLTDGECTLVYSSIGYQSIEKKMSIKNGEAKIINIELVVSTKELSTVVVSAGKFEQKIEEVTVSMAVVKQQHIQDVNTNTMETLMEEVPGVTVIDGQANIRGGSGFSYGAGSRVLVLVDDLPLLAADANDTKWSFIPTEIISQVEVLKGASSALFGSAALNGVINFRTKYPTSKPESNFTLYSGIYDTPRNNEIRWWDKERFVSGFNLSHARKIGSLDLVIGGHYLKDDGYRLGETEERVRGNINTRYHFKSVPGLSAGINLNMQRAEGGLFFIWQDDTTGAYLPQGGLDTATTTISEYVTTRVTIDPFISYLGKHGNHKLRTRYFKSDNKNNTNQQSEAAMYYGEYQYQRTIGSMLVVTAGTSYLKNDVKAELYGNHTQENTSLFGQADFKYKRLNVSFGGRYERFINDTDDVVKRSIFRCGLNYRFFKATYLRASYGQGFRYPSIAEQYIRTQVGNVVVYPNDSLTAETGWSSEIGIRQILINRNWLLELDGAIFWTEYADMMEFTFGVYGKPPGVPLGGAGFKSLNIGNTKVTGYDLTLNSKFDFLGVSYMQSIGYTYIDPIKKDFNPAVDTIFGTANYNILKYRYNNMWKLDTEFDIRKFSIGFNARYYSFMENIDAIFEKLITGVEHYRSINNKGIWVCDARISYVLQNHITFSFNVKNCFNKEYVTRPADMQPPRTFNLQVSVKF